MASVIRPHQCSRMAERYQCYFRGMLYACACALLESNYVIMLVICSDLESDGILPQDSILEDVAFAILAIVIGMLVRGFILDFARLYRQ